MIRKPKAEIEHNSDNDSFADIADIADDTSQQEISDNIFREASGNVAARKSASRLRRRQRIDNRLSLKMSVIYFILVFVIAILLVVIPRDTASSVERRTLAEWPTFSFESYFAGEYTSAITEYYDDTIPARDTFKNIGNNIKTLSGITSSSTVEVIGTIKRTSENTSDADSTSGDTTDAVSANGTVSSTDSEDTVNAANISDSSDTASEDSSSEEETHSKDYTLENADATLEDGILVVYQDGHWRGLALFGGYFDTTFTDDVNYVSSVVEDDINVYVMPVPVATQFYLPANYADYSNDMEEVFQDMIEYLNDDVTAIDIIGVLNDHNEEAIYLRTDHHWAQLGAYYAAKEFCEAAGVDFAGDLENDYTEYVNEGYVGTMYAYTESSNILNDPEDFVYWVPKNSYTVDYYDTYFNYLWSGGLFADTDVANSYVTFMGGDSHIVKVTTDVDNDRVLLVIKDSYANAEIPFYTNSFHQIFVIDPRYFDVNLVDFINYNGITDVLFGYGYFSLSGAMTELLDYAIYNNYENPIYDDAPEAELPER